MAEVLSELFVGLVAASYRNGGIISEWWTVCLHGYLCSGLFHLLLVSEETFEDHHLIVEEVCGFTYLRSQEIHIWGNGWS